MCSQGSNRSLCAPGKYEIRLLSSLVVGISLIFIMILMKDQNHDKTAELSRNLTTTNTQIQIHKYNANRDKTAKHSCSWTTTNTQIQIHKYKHTIHKLTYIMQRTEPTTNCAMISSSANLGPITRKQLFPKQRFPHLFTTYWRMTIDHNNTTSTTTLEETKGI